LLSTDIGFDGKKFHNIRPSIMKKIIK